MKKSDKPPLDWLLKYPPDQPTDWPPEDLVKLAQSLVPMEQEAPTREKFADFVREIASLVDPMGARNIRTIFDISGQDFLFDRASTLLGIICGIHAKADDVSRREAADLLFRVVATKDVEVLEMILRLMSGPAPETHDISLALNIRRRLEIKNSRVPTKGEIRALMLKSRCRLKSGDAKGWSRFWKDAGLDYLPRASAKRSSSKNGDKYRAPKEA